MRIDLHMHSTASDGTDTPEALLAKVREEGLDIFALTDHDTYVGASKIQSLLKPGDPRFIPGIEFSCEDEDGKCHLLGYAYRSGETPVRRVARESHERRLRKVDVRLKYLRDTYGFHFDESDRQSLLAQSNPGKPHIARLMMGKGFASSISEAIDLYMGHFPKTEKPLDAGEAVRAVRESGGIPVLAHPVYGSGNSHLGRELLERRIRRLLREGLMGLETWYSTYTAGERALVTELAETFGLLQSAGSDYHGKNKTILLGQTGLPEQGELPEPLLRLLEECRSRGWGA